MTSDNEKTTKASKFPRWLLIAPLVVGLSLVGGAALIQTGLENFRSGDRVVTVRGLATRDVEADLAIWPIKFSATDNNLQTARAQLEDNAQKIQEFLSAQGIKTEDIQILSIESQDLLAQSYRPEGVSQGRYLLTQTFVVRTGDIASVVKGAQNIAQLLSRNVVLTNTAAPTYLFTKLNDIKPEMIAEATRNARESADQFAKDSGQKVGLIRSASQGYFEIQPRDPVDEIPAATQRNKTVRVVTSVDYYLR